MFMCHDLLQSTVMKEVLARALRALAVAPLNCSLILDAGGLQPLTDMLAGNNQELAHQAVAVMSLLTKVVLPFRVFSIVTSRSHWAILTVVSHPTRLPEDEVIHLGSDLLCTRVLQLHA
jgi:hypothetical protein